MHRHYSSGSCDWVLPLFIHSVASMSVVIVDTAMLLGVVMGGAPLRMVREIPGGADGLSCDTSLRDWCCVERTVFGRSIMSRRKHPLRERLRSFSVSSYGRVDRGIYAEDNPMWGVDRAVGRRVISTTALLLLALGAVACADDSDSSPSTPNVTDPTTVTTPAASSTSTSITTSTTSNSTSSPSTTSTTTGQPPASPEDDIRAAIALAQQSFSDCLVAMPQCDPSTLSVARAGPLLERNVARVQEWNAAGYTVRNRDQFRFVVESVTLGSDGRTASATVCIADGSDLVHPGAGPGGADVIVDDAYTSGRSAWDMRLDPDGKWRAYDAPAVGPTESSDVCPAA